jgi:hypothetical protein
MRKLIISASIAAGLVLGLLFTPLASVASSVTNALYPVAAKFTSTVATNGVAFKCVNNCAIDLGSGANDWISSNGTSVVIGQGGLSVYGGSITTTGGTPLYLSGTGAVNMTTGININLTAIGTCDSTKEGDVRRMTGTGGTGTTLRTRMCICTSDGAASPAYAWMNLVSGTVGNSTTCSL